MSMPLDLMLSLVFACANNWWREMMEAKKRQRREGSKSARDVVAIFVPLCFYFWMDACVCVFVCVFALSRKKLSGIRMSRSILFFSVLVLLLH